MIEIEKFKDYYQKTKNSIDDALKKFNEEIIQEDNPYLKENLEYFKELNSDGKNIRGTLVNLGYYLQKEDVEYATPLALAYEVFQTSILIHDDIIDKDDKRRGKDTIHAIHNRKSREQFQEEDPHFSNSVAIFVGNYGLFCSNKIIADSYQENPLLGKVLSCFNSTALNTIKGELLDIILPYYGKRQTIQYDELEKSIHNIYRLKTAHYTIIGPLSVGLLLAGATEKQIEEITPFGEKVGIAFQIQDDLLGIFSEDMGKGKGSNISDIKEFKQTILYSHIIQTEEKDAFLKYYGKEDLTEKEIEKVKELLTKSGSKKYAEDTMNRLYDEGIQELDNIVWIPNDKKELLRGFVNYLRIRNK